MKLIIRAPNWIGDAIMSLTAVDNARDLTGADHIAVMARRSTAPLYRNHPDIDRVVEINDKSSFPAGPFQAAASIKSERYDIGVILPPSFSSALIFRLAGVRKRIGYRGDKRSFLLTDAIKPFPSGQHRSERYLRLLETFSDKRLACRNPCLYISEEDNASGKQILESNAIRSGQRFVAIAPRAVAESRRWGGENYSDLSMRLINEFDLKIILLGTDKDFSFGEKVVAAGSGNVINLCGKTRLMEAAAILAEAQLFVGNDSGLAHLAGAVGCNLVVLSGADDPAETSPRTEKKKVIIKNLECISCVKNICPLLGDSFMRCMKSITVDEVYEAAKRFIRN